MLVFEERGKLEYPEKNLSEQGREPVKKTKWTGLLARTRAILFFTFLFEYSISSLESYWDFREMGPVLQAGGHGFNPRPDHQTIFDFRP